MSSVDRSERLLNDARDRLETASTLVELVRDVTVDRLLRNTDAKRFEALTYDAAPTVRALLCRELAGLSRNSLYEFLSTEDRAVRLGFAPANFGPYNTAPTRRTLTKIWDHDLSDAAKRTLLSLSERLVDTVYENDAALDLRPPRRIEATDSDLRERHVGTFSNAQLRKHVRLARETVFGSTPAARRTRHIRTAGLLNSRQ